MDHLIFRIDEKGRLTKTPDPWFVGMPGTEITIALINDHKDHHRVEMRWFEHKGTRKNLDPLTGQKFLQAFGYQRTHSEHKVRNHGKPFYGSYTYVSALDGVEGPDPEIVVDEPPPIIRTKKAGMVVGAAIGGLLGVTGGALYARSDEAPTAVREQPLVASLLLGGVCAAIGAWVARVSERSSE